MLCDYQPHPLGFVWCFLLAGLVRSHTSAVRSGRSSRLWWNLCASSALVDFISYHLFLHAAEPELHSVQGVAYAWLLSFVSCFLLRVLAVCRCLHSATLRCCTPMCHSSRLLPASYCLLTHFSHQSGLVLIWSQLRTPSGLMTIVSAALSSLCVFLVATLLLKQELQVEFARDGEELSQSHIHKHAYEPSPTTPILIAAQRAARSLPITCLNIPLLAGARRCPGCHEVQLAYRNFFPWGRVCTSMRAMP
jgi:hypothetical protein